MDLKQKAIELIQARIETARFVRDGGVDLDKLNAPLSPENRYATLDDFFQELIQEIHHAIQFAVDLGLLDRKTDRATLNHFDSELSFPLLNAKREGFKNIPSQ